MRNRFVRMILLALAGGIFLLSSLMVLKYIVEMRAGEKQDEELYQMITATVPRETEPKPTEEITVDEADPLEEETYVRVEAPIQVDFEALLAENSDVVGWLYSPDTKINYPVAQTTDNDYYLDHLLNGRPNGRGTLFMDYRNEAELSHWNTVIYGHNMNNMTMFGTLTKYKKQAYFDAHPEMYFLTPEGDYLVKIVAGFVARPNDAIFNAFNPEDAEKQKDLLESWMAASTFDSGIKPTLEDRLITLSTCTYEFKNARYVLIGILTDRAE